MRTSVFLLVAFAVSSVSAYKIKTLDDERQPRSFDNCVPGQSSENSCKSTKCPDGPQGFPQWVMQFCPSNQELEKDCPVPSKNANECCKKCKCVDHDGTTYNNGDQFIYGTSDNTYDCECKNGKAVCQVKDNGQKNPNVITTARPAPTWDWGNWGWDSN